MGVRQITVRDCTNQELHIRHEINPSVFPGNGDTICNHFALRGQLIRAYYSLLPLPFYIISCSETRSNAIFLSVLSSLT